MMNTGHLSGGAMLLVMGLVVAPVHADELMLQVEQGLAALGYSTGPVDGNESLETTIAISKFQSENGLPVTGEATPQLAGALAAKAGAGGEVAMPAAVPDEAALRAAQQACLQEKVEAKQASQKKKRGFASLASAASRVASRMGIGTVSGAIQDVYSANATAEDLSSAAKDLGLTEDEVAACRNP